MNLLCHRCGASLETSDLFCASCGAPQVKLVQAEEIGAPYATPRPPGLAAPPHGISWKDAITAALIVAVPAGILSAVAVLSWGCCLWIVGGSVLCIGLYRKRAPEFLLEGRIGFRIGAAAGVIAACSSITATAIGRMVARYALHQGSSMDHFYETVIQQSAALIQSNPQAQTEWRTYVHFLQTPDGRAAFTLLNAATTSLGIVLFSAIGGILGVRLFGARKGALDNR